MYASPLKLVGLSAGLAAAAPFSYPLQNGFPQPSNDTLRQISVTAGGTLSNGPPPPKVDEDTLQSFKLIAFNELFETAFFTDLIANITNHVPGYDKLDAGEEKFVLEALKAVQAQEELHTLNANNVLKKFNAPIIEPCKYNFPVNDFDGAIALANTFTDVVLGTLRDVQQDAATAQGADAAPIIAGVAGTLGQEGQQDGFYRSIQGKRPSSQPFLTPSVREFAFTALQNFVVPGSCPNIDTIKLTIFEQLTLLTEKPCNGPIQFSAKNTYKAKVDPATQKLVYINGANLPIVRDFVIKETKGDMVTVEAFFPHDEFVMDGLTIAAITNTAGPFNNADAVAKAAVYGPGLIEVN